MRRLLPRSEMAARGPVLALSLVCLVVAVVLMGTGRPLGAMTALVAAFLLVAAAKRS